MQADQFVADLEHLIFARSGGAEIGLETFQRLQVSLARSDIVSNVSLTKTLITFHFVFFLKKNLRQEVLVGRGPLVERVGTTREAIDQRLDALLTLELGANGGGAVALLVAERRPEAVDVRRREASGRRVRRATLHAQLRLQRRKLRLEIELRLRLWRLLVLLVARELGPLAFDGAQRVAKVARLVRFRLRNDPIAQCTSIMIVLYTPTPQNTQ